MSIDTTLQRVSAIERTLAHPAALLTGSGEVGASGGVVAPAGGQAAAAAVATAASTALTPASTTGEQPGATSFASALQLAYGSAAPTAPAPAPGWPGARIVSAAESQVGQAEQPPGSNESPAISMYREATAGSIPGAPWCAYFASWAARQAGEPLGAQGQGLGSVSEIWSWAQSVGRAVPNGPGVSPQPGDLIVFGGEHVGIVKEVLPNGSIETIEGNYENKVALNVRTATEATGYVSMG